MTNGQDNIPELTIERMEDKQGCLILLEQNSCGNIDRVAIHPVQLRYMAEKFGLIETSDPQAAKTIATLTRRLHLLRDRVKHLADAMTTNPSKCQQDYAQATADIAGEFCAELVEAPPCSPDAGTVQPSLI